MVEAFGVCVYFLNVDKITRLVYRIHASLCLHLIHLVASRIQLVLKFAICNFILFTVGSVCAHWSENSIKFKIIFTFIWNLFFELIVVNVEIMKEIQLAFLLLLCCIQAFGMDPPRKYSLQWYQQKQQQQNVKEKTNVLVPP